MTTTGETSIRLKRDTYEHIRKHVDIDHSFDDLVREAFRLPKRSKK
jgi:hypothetical protein